MFNTRLFRRESLQAYLSQRTDQVYPPTLSRRLLAALWAGVLVLFASLGILWSYQIPIYTPVRLIPQEATATDQYLINAPAGVRLESRQTLYQNGQAVARIVSVKRESADAIQVQVNTDKELPDVLLVITAHQRLGTYLPLLGPLFQ
jgi:hypothetical protein